ncbi:MAG: lysylphosphatidylglycerol synthase transmembrane domain-containing protein [Planctomycetota bacterium]
MSEEALPARRRWPPWWRLAGPLLLGVMLWRVGPANIWSELRDADPLWFASACALSVPALAVKAYRWQTILRAAGHEVSLADCAGVYAAGSLAGAVTPGKVGDFAKAPLLASRGVPWKTGVAASLLDRALDATLLFVAGLGSLLMLPALPGLPGQTILGASLAAGITLSVGVAVAIQRLFPRVFRLSGFGWWLVAGATTLGGLAPYFGSVYCCARALRLPLSLLDSTAGSAVAAVLSLLPVTVGGIGTRDAAFVTIFARRGVDAEHAIALSGLVLAWMAVNCVLFYAVARLCGHRQNSCVPSTPLGSDSR